MASEVVFVGAPAVAGIAFVFVPAMGYQPDGVAVLDGVLHVLGAAGSSRRRPGRPPADAAPFRRLDSRRSAPCV